MQSNKLLPKKILKRTYFVLANLGVLMLSKLLNPSCGYEKLLQKYSRLYVNINNHIFQLQSIDILPKKY